MYQKEDHLLHLLTTADCGQQTMESKGAKKGGPAAVGEVVYGARGNRRISVLSAQSCCHSKTAMKHSPSEREKKEKWPRKGERTGEVFRM